MTKLTDEILNNITTNLVSKKAVLLDGGSGVGKSFLSRLTAKRLESSEYNFFDRSDNCTVITRVCVCHNGTAYEEFVQGITPYSENDMINYHYEDKILLKMIKAAADSYYHKHEKKYLLILEDVQRTDLTELFGETISAIGTRETFFYLNSGEKISITPNFYLIATYNGTLDNSVMPEAGILAKFYSMKIPSNMGFVDDDTSGNNLALYNSVRQTVMGNMTSQFRQFRNKWDYLPGHGYFKKDNASYSVKYRVVPLLYEYIKDGILDDTAFSNIKAIEEKCCTDVRKDIDKSNRHFISGYRHDVNREKFVNDEKTSEPLENLIGRIIQQGIISENEIISNILKNDHICYRQKLVNGASYIGTLIADEASADKMRRNGGDRRSYYNAEEIDIDGHKYFFSGGMQPHEYTNGIKGYQGSIWDIDEPIQIGESTKPNILIFGIMKYYFKTLIEDVDACYNGLYRQRYHDYLQNSWNIFLESYKQIKPNAVNNPDPRIKKNMEGQENANAQKRLRELIGRIEILWKNIGDVITVQDGEELIVERMERVMSDNKFEEYDLAMNKLGIRQMILQGPPGTSKTYSAKAFIKYKAEETGIDADINKLKITDFTDDECYCAYAAENNGQSPKVAWDIVQFHPSYGYEDFIRGIKVSTDDNSHQIKYETVDKVLGGMAKLAENNKDTSFYLIIDEINRANLATVFGELIYALEYRDEKVETPYSVNGDNDIDIPDNLFIIGTMNTADKSIGSIDYAIRRRFLFFEQLPDRSVIENYKTSDGDDRIKINKKASCLFDNVGRLFEKEILSREYRKEDVQIGHTYFLVDDEEELKMRFKYQIIPILKEYYKDGIINFISDVENNKEFNGFLNCISGNIDIDNDTDDVDSIFESLTEENGVS